jgi:hypothetical protein
MPHRQFVDTNGSLWAVWDVRPLAVRQSLDQGRDAHSGLGRTTSGTHLDQALAEGWLCFESGDQKRRLAPIPSGWDSLTVDELVKLCREAAGVRRRARSGGEANGEHPSA